jgi:hypothetical protein
MLMAAVFVFISAVASQKRPERHASPGCSQQQPGNSENAADPRVFHLRRGIGTDLAVIYDFGVEVKILPAQE